MKVEGAGVQTKKNRPNTGNIMLNLIIDTLIGDFKGSMNKLISLLFHLFVT